MWQSMGSSIGHLSPEWVVSIKAAGVSLQTVIAEILEMSSVLVHADGAVYTRRGTHTGGRWLSQREIDALWRRLDPQLTAERRERLKNEMKASAQARQRQREVEEDAWRRATSWME